MKRPHDIDEFLAECMARLEEARKMPWADGGRDAVKHLFFACLSKADAVRRPTCTRLCECREHFALQYIVRRANELAESHGDHWRDMVNEPLKKQLKLDLPN